MMVEAQFTRLMTITGLLVILLTPSVCLAEVEGNCTMCHKYPGLGRIENNSDDPNKQNKRVFYINNKLFEETYHGKIRCKSCHTGVNKIPHTDAPAVDCSTDCHIMDPSSKKSFSHKKIVSDFNNSVHGKKGSNLVEKNDLPVCKDCHNNKTYHADIEKMMDSDHKVTVCKECHESKEFVKQFYEHIIYRTGKRRSSKDVVKLCSTCHADKELMDRAGLDTVVGFTSTFHAKAIKFGNEEVANCLNCHAPYEMGFSPHRITSRKKEHSPVSVKNRINTCRQSECHTEATKEFAIGTRVHPSPEKIQFLKTSVAVNPEDKSIIDDPVFQTKVLGWIHLFYKILILAVVGGLGMHRVLDMYATNRERRLRGK